MSVITKPQRKMQYNLRIEHDLHEWLKKVAEENERPVNYVINQAIKKLRNELESAKA
ncbi:MAG: Arc family DNA-binding protein [Acinetobacter sp.]|nr:Arc family DNA-binding protein [Acinetobacter sp.]